ncbi:MAG: hypothetical protein ACK53Y_24475, partial [bacterium]
MNTLESDWFDVEDMIAESATNMNRVSAAPLQLCCHKKMKDEMVNGRSYEVCKYSGRMYGTS